MSSWNVRHISTFIRATPERVYQYTSDPKNLPSWASGLATKVENVDGKWFADSALGRVEVRFAPRNDLGVLDHDVTLPSGVTVHNPLRVLPNATGSEVVLSVFQLPGMSDAELEKTAKTVAKDLDALKRALEGDSPAR